MRTRRRPAAGWAMAALAAALLGGCAPSEAPPSLTGAGATFPFPLYSKWFQEYERAAGVQINYQAIGSGGGIQQLGTGTVDFGATDAALTDAEMASMDAPVLHLPTVAGAVAIVYNLPGIPTGLRFSPEVLGGIFLGAVNSWSDHRIAELNPAVSLPALPIAVARRSDSSGTTDIFTRYLAMVHRPWADRVGAGKAVDWPVGMGAKGNDGVAGLVRQTPGAIGYVELAYAEQAGMSYAYIRNQAGAFVAPSVAATTAAAASVAELMKEDIRVSLVDAPGSEAYPIAGFTYLLVYQRQRDPAKGRLLVEFLRWAMEEGQQSAAGLLYAPLPPEVVALNLAAIESIELGREQ